MHRDIEERLYEHCLQANALEGLMQGKSADGAMMQYMEAQSQFKLVSNRQSLFFQRLVASNDLYFLNEQGHKPELSPRHGIQQVSSTAWLLSPTHVRGSHSFQVGLTEEVQR